jgi:hypothetical protein
MPSENVLLKTQVQDDRSPRAAAGAAQGGPSAGCRKRTRAIRCLLAGALSLALVYFLHPLALCWLAVALTAGAPRPAEADFICLAAVGIGPEAVTAYRKRPDCRILLFPQRRNRMIELGVVTPAEWRIRRSLEEARVARSQIVIDERPVATDWELAERLSERLAADPQATMLILCDQFSGQRWRQIVRETAPGDVARRIHVQSARDPVVHPLNWWHSKAGIQGVFHGYLGLMFAVLHGRENAPPGDAPAAVYEELSRQRSMSRM